jgi:hypothetical protein
MCPYQNKFIDLFERFVSKRRAVVWTVKNYFANSLGRADRIKIRTRNRGLIR